MEHNNTHQGRPSSVVIPQYVNFGRLYFVMEIKMSKPEKPLYELRTRSKHYVGIWQGKHCLAAVCVKKPRGLSDAQLIVLALNAYEEAKQ